MNVSYKQVCAHREDLVLKVPILSQTSTWDSVQFTYSRGIHITMQRSKSRLFKYLWHMLMLQYDMLDSSSEWKFWQFYKLQCLPYSYTKEKKTLIWSNFLFFFFLQTISKSPYKSLVLLLLHWKNRKITSEFWTVGLVLLKSLALEYSWLCFNSP